MNYTENFNTKNDYTINTKFNFENNTELLVKHLSPELFVSIICIFKSLHDFYSFNILSINDIQIKYTKNKSQNNNLIFITLDKGCIKVKSDILPIIVCGSKVNSVFNYNHFYSYSGLPSTFISLFTLFFHKFKSNKRVYPKLIEPFLTSFGDSIASLIINNQLEYLNIDTLPSFEELCNQMYTVFSDYLQFINPPIVPYSKSGTIGELINKIENKSKLLISQNNEQNEYDKELTAYINKILPNLQYTIEKIKGISYIYMFPVINSTKSFIYPNLSEFNENEIESIFQYWLKGADVNIHLSLYHHFKMFENQYKLVQVFEPFIKKNNYLFMYPQTWSLSQVKSIQNKNNLIDVVGKFLFGKHRNNYQNKILNTLIKDYSDEDDITFYYECSKHYKSTYYDRSVARVKEIDKLDIWNDIKGKKYLDFGGGDGQNAYSISKVLDCKKGDVYVSDVQSWFGNENVQKYKDILTYRYLKTFLLPFEDDMFDFITVFQVLHHIRSYELTIRELYRILKKDGIILIREHDCDSYETATLIDIEHSLFEISSKTDIDYTYLQNYYAHYFSRIELYSLLESVGFVHLNKNNKIVETESLGPTRYYLSVWTKK